MTLQAFISIGKTAVEYGVFVFASFLEGFRLASMHTHRLTHDLRLTATLFAETVFGGKGIPPEETAEPDFDDGISILLVETGGEGEVRLD